MLTNTQVEQHHVAYAVGLIALAQTVVMYLGIPMKSPKLYVISSIAVYGYIMPFLLRTDQCWTSFPMKLFVSIIILVLDWFSFHEDASRFSEEKVCIFGNCRFNARVTGHLAHWADVATIGVLMWPYVQTSHRNVMLLLGGLGIYGTIGSKVIEEYTKDDSESDIRVRGKCRARGQSMHKGKDHVKCLERGLESDHNRTGHNGSVAGANKIRQNFHKH